MSTTKADPLSVACPQCGAEVGVRCWSGTRRGRHLSRGHHVPESFETFLRREIHRVVEDEVLSGRKKPS